MSISGPKIFKLNFDGSFDNIAYENIKEVFTIVNILAIYVTQKKTMYIWIGQKATQALKNHISNIRVLVKEEFPDFRIIRNNTVEMREEPYDFFQNLNINKEELYEQIDYQEKILLPILNDIDKLKDKSERFIKTTSYEDALKTTKEIIEMAKKIGDEALIAEQEKLISELTTKGESKKVIDEITNKTTEFEKKFHTLIEKREFLSANNILEEFKKVLGENYDLTQVPSTTEFITNGEKILKKEQDRLQRELKRLENDLLLSFKNLDTKTAVDIMREGNSLLLNLLNDEIKVKWKKLDDDLKIVKQKIELKKDIDTFFTESKLLKNNYQFKEIKVKIEELVPLVKNLNFSDYQKKLESFKKEILSAEKSYNKSLSEIVELEKLIKDNQANNLIDDILKNCEKILKIAKSINKSDIVESYLAIVKQTESLKEENRLFEENQQKLKQELSNLVKSLTSALKNFELSKASEIIQKGKMALIELVDEEIKKKWDAFEKKYLAAKSLIEDIEKLSKSGLQALETKAYEESLKFYKQIVEQIESYES